MKIYYFILFNSRSRAILGREEENPKQNKNNTQNPSQPELHRQVAVPLAKLTSWISRTYLLMLWLTYFRHYFGCSNQPLTESQSSKYQALNPSWKPDTFPGMLDYRENQQAPLVETLLCISLHIHKAQNISWFLRCALTPSTLELPLFTTHGDSCEIALLFLQCKIWQIEMICISILSPWGTVCLPVHHNTFKNPYHSIIL